MINRHIGKHDPMQHRLLAGEIFVQQDALITLTADIVAAHVSNNSVSVGDIGNLVQRVHGALAGLGEPQQEEEQEKVPAVSVRASLKPDHLVCMECGRKQKTLRRHLQSAHGMTPEQYRSDYGLPRDYPMVAPNYSEQRRELAKSIGLGRKRAETAPAPTKAAGRKPRAKKEAPPAEPDSGENEASA